VLECLNGNITFDFGADRDHDPDSGIFNGIITTARYGHCRNFEGSAALAEVALSKRFSLVILFYARRTDLLKRISGAIQHLVNYRPHCVIVFAQEVS